eukprot:TRINITY_DN104910_c0_g1_i1.p1 TRINITY_DN104910_c0_g1~~TRINITY_DN104910_c0_g1_i1.p1  ORF type:complete len:261 (+),score=28.87 TRINITY_DN104910_c0_g1_i1:703-1485(+)
MKQRISSDVWRSRSGPQDQVQDCSSSPRSRVVLRTEIMSLTKHQRAPELAAQATGQMNEQHAPPKVHANGAEEQCIVKAGTAAAREAKEQRLSDDRLLKVAFEQQRVAVAVACDNGQLGKARGCRGCADVAARRTPRAKHNAHCYGRAWEIVCKAPSCQVCLIVKRMKVNICSGAVTSRSAAHEQAQPRSCPLRLRTFPMQLKSDPPRVAAVQAASGSSSAGSGMTRKAGDAGILAGSADVDKRLCKLGSTSLDGLVVRG